MELVAGDVRLVVDPERGGRWTSLLIGDLELLAHVEVPVTYPPVLGGCYPMAPYAGRVRDAELTFRGTHAALPVVDPPHAMHGTVFDVPWQGWTCELGDRWPFSGTVTQELSLTAQSLTAVLTLQAREAMPCTLGFHPWFRRQLARGGPAALHLVAAEQYQRGSDGLPTGALIPPLKGPWDDCFTGFADPIRLTWPGALALELSSSADHWVVFDEHPDTLCVEPQTGPPDAVNLGVAQVLEAGQTATLTFGLAWT